VSIEDLIAQFDTNSIVISRLIWQLSATDPLQFQKSALRAIADVPDSGGVRFLASLIALNEPVLELIANPQVFELNDARRIVEALRRNDPQAEVKMLRLITANPAKRLPPQVTDRILDVIDAITEGPRLVPVLMQIFRSANPYLRARLALSIGKRHRNKDWIEDRMRDPDPRVRANAVEANWRQQDEPAFSLFNIAMRDVHHRVIGNGAVGLYYAGDVRSLRVFGELIRHEVSDRRAAGLWAVAHVQDTRFHQLLANMIDESDLVVRRLLVAAAGRLKRASEIRSEGAKLQLRLIKATRKALPSTEDGGPPKFHNHVFLEVKGPGSTYALQGLGPLQFHIFENEQAILEYSAQERTSYIKPGTYDLYFTSCGKSPKRHLQIIVVTETASGEYDSYDSGPAKPVADESAWDVLRRSP